MPDAPIGVFDSGIGGTTVLQAVRKLLPHEDFVFFGDSKNCPFGTKDTEELKEIVRSATEFLLEKQVKLIIVACNTATTQAIEYLRETFPNIQFVGTEPAVKLACDSGAMNIIMLSTEGTAHSPRTQELIEKNTKSGQKLVNVPCLGLAEAIETRDIEKIRSSLELNFMDIDDKEKIDAVVLGCTHYPLASTEIQKFFPNAKLMDGGEGVARQVKKLLEEKGLLSSRSKPGEVSYYFSKAE